MSLLKDQEEINSNKENDCSIVDIVFTFKSKLSSHLITYIDTRLIGLAEKRGNAIKQGDTDRRFDIETEIIKKYDG